VPVSIPDREVGLPIAGKALKCLSDDSLQVGVSEGGFEPPEHVGTAGEVRIPWVRNREKGGTASRAHHWHIGRLDAERFHEAQESQRCFLRRIDDVCRLLCRSRDGSAVLTVSGDICRAAAGLLGPWVNLSVRHGSSSGVPESLGSPRGPRTKVEGLCSRSRRLCA
jgi:hypothetical protein